MEDSDPWSMYPSNNCSCSVVPCLSLSSSSIFCISPEIGVLHWDNHCAYIFISLRILMCLLRCQHLRPHHHKHHLQTKNCPQSKLQSLLCLSQKGVGIFKNLKKLKKQVVKIVIEVEKDQICFNLLPLIFFFKELLSLRINILEAIIWVRTHVTQKLWEICVKSKLLFICLQAYFPT